MNLLNITSDLSITNFNQELINWFEDNERDLFDKMYFEMLPPVIKYNDKSFKDYVYICIKNENKVLKIIDVIENKEA